MPSGNGESVVGWLQTEAKAQVVSLWKAAAEAIRCITRWKPSPDRQELNRRTEQRSHSN